MVIISAFQADDVGSIPTDRSKFGLLAQLVSSDRLLSDRSQVQVLHSPPRKELILSTLKEVYSIQNQLKTTASGRPRFES